jgi:hypothetical protein
MEAKRSEGRPTRWTHYPDSAMRCDIDGVDVLLTLRPTPDIEWSQYMTLDKAKGIAEMLAGVCDGAVHWLDEDSDSEMTP